MHLCKCTGLPLQYAILGRKLIWMMSEIHNLIPKHLSITCWAIFPNKPWRNKWMNLICTSSSNTLELILVFSSWCSELGQMISTWPVLGGGSIITRCTLPPSLIGRSVDSLLKNLWGVIYSENYGSQGLSNTDPAAEGRLIPCKMVSIIMESPPPADWLQTQF